MSESEIIRHQVAICGMVYGCDGQSAAATPVTVKNTAGRKVASTTTREDGAYYFLDLPDGDYVVTAVAADLPAIVTRNKQGDITIAQIDLTAGKNTPA